MKPFFCIGATALSLFLAASDAHIGEEPPRIDLARRGQYVWRERDRSERTFHPVDISWKSGACEQTTCLHQDAYISPNITWCGVYGIPPPCTRLPIDHPEPFPQCCPQSWCPENSH